mgnify:CR=1 FL=1
MGREQLVAGLKPHVPVTIKTKYIDDASTQIVESGTIEEKSRPARLLTLAGLLFFFLFYALIGFVISIRNDLIQHACLPLPEKSVTAAISQVQGGSYRVEKDDHYETKVHLPGNPVEFHIYRQLKPMPNRCDPNASDLETIHYIGETLHKWHEPQQASQQLGVYILGLEVNVDTQTSAVLRCLSEMLSFPFHSFLGILFTIILPLFLARATMRSSNLLPPDRRDDPPTSGHI